MDGQKYASKHSMQSIDNDMSFYMLIRQKCFKVYNVRVLLRNKIPLLNYFTVPSLTYLPDALVTGLAVWAVLGVRIACSIVPGLPP